MKIQVIAGIVMIHLLAPWAGAVEAPRALGGFVLGAPIDAVADRLQMDTAAPVRQTGCLMEVNIVPGEGFDSGSINYGACAARNRIVRIKLKYEDGSQKFFRMLFERYKQRFGEPTEWKGDPFHVVIAWKWSFKDPDGRRVSLILQHNSQDEEEKIGNSVKMTLSDEMAAEIRHGRESRAKAEPKAPPDRKAPDWERLLPR
ncbi:hypothetical protein [Desulfococcus sp.]|uniref:hypothetical protein n=1 Tax=Desulfococcus sp. TaxID=2025834 RepID=UPI0035944B76